MWHPDPLTFPITLIILGHAGHLSTFLPPFPLASLPLTRLLEVWLMHPQQQHHLGMENLRLSSRHAASKSAFSQNRQVVPMDIQVREVPLSSFLVLCISPCTPIISVASRGVTSNLGTSAASFLFIVTMPTGYLALPCLCIITTNSAFL